MLTEPIFLISTLQLRVMTAVHADKTLHSHLSEVCSGSAVVFLNTINGLVTHNIPVHKHVRSRSFDIGKQFGSFTGRKAQFAVNSIATFPNLLVHESRMNILKKSLYISSNGGALKSIRKALLIFTVLTIISAPNVNCSDDGSSKRGYQISVREKDLLQKLVNKMEYTINIQKEVIALLNDGSLKSNNSAGNVKNNFDKPVMSAPSALTWSYTKSLTTETGSATKNPPVNITKMDSRSATPSPDIPKPSAGNIIQAEDVKNEIALAENSFGKDTNKPSTLKDGYQGNKPGE
ncbi:hypothetical protein WA026_017397 [Henosepilachna vigintioctopunctata]|uniref:Uncharacterized protein n=1 Tax=Henosepilachna vigintioctopunctata TaxID=420089 RepID=A0AAW1VE87_9CUCU